MRRASRTDATQAEIVAALRKVGVSVEVIGLPFDLVLYNPRQQEMSFGECKTPRPTSEGGGHGLTKLQVEWVSKWPGRIYIFRSAEDAVRQVLGEEVMA
ncbi:MAG: hypothetical protein Q8P46_03800 [Hyphomicrobiales bacterium]|nr:hypothetical protein [Hyphomicrobiales bacterium]